jgi:nucleotide-binding universal stress UspA family protein
MFKKILFATTVSPDCDDAASYAFDMAMKYNAKLYIYHVCGVPSHGYSRFVINVKTGEKEAYSKEYDAVVKEEIANTYSDLLDQYGNCEIECVIGAPGTEILRKVKKERIDAVVMGAHHQVEDSEAIRYRNITGDTMQRVAKSARCPVLIISRPYNKNLWNLKNILCGTDFSKASMAAFRFALRFARENKCKFHLFHAIDITGGQFGKVPTQLEIEEMVASASKKIDDTYLTEMEGYMNFETAVWEGIPYVEILKYAREHNIDLISMAHHTGSIFQKKDILGSTIEEVVLRSLCPVASINRMDVLEDYEVFLA